MPPRRARRGEPPQTPEHASPEAQDQRTVVEAMLDEMVQGQDPWGYIATITDQRIDPAQRQNFYQNFITMIAIRPPSEQDALIAAGQSVFRYRVDTARRDLAAIRETTGGVTKVTPSVVDDTLIADAIFNPEGLPPVRYVLAHTDTGQIEIVDRVQLGGTVHVPPQSTVVGAVQDRRAKGCLVLLPTEARAYGAAADLARAVRHHMRQWVEFPDKVSELFAVAYVFLTWIVEVVETVPYLRLLGDFGSGKTRAATVIAALSFRPIYLAGATTPAPIFRLMERWRSTLSLDEADFNADTETGALLEKILLVGYRRGGLIARVEDSQDGRDVATFDAFGCKIITARRSFREPALDSRCLDIYMPARDQVGVAAQLDNGFWAAALQLRNQLQRWRIDTVRTLTLDTTEQVIGTVPRVREIGLPLLAVVRAISGQAGSLWERQIIERLQTMSARVKADRADSWEGIAAGAVVALLGSNGGGRVDAARVLQRVHSDHPGLRDSFTMRRVGKVLREGLGLATPRINGLLRVEVTGEQLGRLRGTYDLARRQPVPSVAQSRPVATGPGRP